MIDILNARCNMYKGGLLTCLAFRAIDFISLSLDVDECATSPCENAGSCVNDKGGYHCMCALGFEGSNCDGGTGPIQLMLAGALPRVTLA